MVILSGLTTFAGSNLSIEEKAKSFYAAIDAADANTIKNNASADFKFFNPFTPQPLDVNGLIGFSSQIKSSFSQAKHQITKTIASANSVTVIGAFTGKFTSDFNGIPATNKDVAVEFITVFEMDATGKILKMTAQNNSYSFMIQLGAVPAPNPDSHIPAVMTLYGAFGKGDIPGLVQMLDPNIKWDSHLNPMISNARIYKGSQDVFNFFGALKESSEITAFNPMNFYESGNTVYILGSFDYTLLKDMKKYHVNWTMSFEFAAGKPVVFTEYFDSPQLRN